MNIVAEKKRSSVRSSLILNICRIILYEKSKFWLWEPLDFPWDTIRAFPTISSTLMACEIGP